MLEFKQKILIIGCGSVAQCSLPMILKHIAIDPSQITLIDFEDNRHRIQEALLHGVKYVKAKIDANNYPSLLGKYLESGDICIDLAWDIDTYAMIEWCDQHSVHYLNTSVEVWDALKEHESKSLQDLTLYSRHMKLRELSKNSSFKRSCTAIVDHGANPGLVSHFTKKALIDISNAICHESKDKNRIQQLLNAIEAGDFASLAYLTGVKVIHISERDSQIHQEPKQMNEFVNTWSIRGLIEEGLAPAEIGWGTHETDLPTGALTHLHGPQNQICLTKRGMHTWVRSWVPSGEIKGMVIRHGEAFSISDHLTLRYPDGQLHYRPTVHYAYCPSDSTLNSLHEFEMRRYKLQAKLRIINDEILTGVDELGCLLMGHDFHSWWVGSLLDIQTARRLVPGQNATTVQVAAGVLSGLIYIIRHPCLGLCLPDDLNYQEILAEALPYLGEFISAPVDWQPIQLENSLGNKKASKSSRDTNWQFSAFCT